MNKQKLIHYKFSITWNYYKVLLGIILSDWIYYTDISSGIQVPNLSLMLTEKNWMWDSFMFAKGIICGKWKAGLWFQFNLLRSESCGVSSCLNSLKKNVSTLIKTLCPRNNMVSGPQTEKWCQEHHWKMFWDVFIMIHTHKKYCL